MYQRQPSVPRTYGWAAEVLVSLPQQRVFVSPHQHYQYQQQAQLWVEEMVAGQLAQGVPATLLLGRVRFGEVDKDPKNVLMLIPTSVTVTQSYEYVGGQFAWAEPAVRR